MELLQSDLDMGNKWSTVLFFGSLGSITTNTMIYSISEGQIENSETYQSSSSFCVVNDKRRIAQIKI